MKVMTEVVRHSASGPEALLTEGKVVVAFDGRLVAILRLTIRPNTSARQLTVKGVHGRTSDRVGQNVGE